ncbi:MAG: hypothetical protein HYZ58_15800 [Acidobacteria bacterium]|nr:hypothetical protein [Acidobacteriota bacterium]MBI3264590.1 hypothetical protein [Acidobacteriota bacterium]
MGGIRTTITGVLMSSALAAGVLGQAGQRGQGQTPSPLPLTHSIRERGSSVTGAYEGWYPNKDGSISLLVGYFNRNTKQELDIPPGPDNRIEPGGLDQGQPTHFLTGRQWGVFTIKVPKDFGDKKLTWTLTANGQTNVITMHLKPEWVVEPYEDAANRNTPPVIKFEQSGAAFTGPPSGIAATYTTTMPDPLTLTAWLTDEGPKINIPEPPAGGRGRGRGGRGADDPQAAARGRGADDPEAQGRGRGRGVVSADATAVGFPQAPPLSMTLTVFRGPGTVTFANPKPAIDREAGGKATTTATFSAPGEYILRVQANDSTGEGGGGFQCCWTNAHVKVTVKPPATSGR